MSSYDERDEEVDGEIRKLKNPVMGPTVKCVHCGSDKIIPAAAISQGEGMLKVAVMADPSALIFKGYESEEVSASICGECGHTLFFTKNPGRLYRVYLTSLKLGII